MQSIISRRVLTIALIGTLSGCVDDVNIGSIDRSDLSEYDENGIQSYENGYGMSQESLDDFEEKIRIHLDEDASISENELHELYDVILGVAGSFSEASDLFTEARRLSESPAFNEPCIDASNWASLWASALGYLIEGAPRDSSELYQNYSYLSQDKFEEAREVGEPIPPEELLESVLQDY